MEFAKLANHCSSDAQVSVPKWKPPPMGFYKINVDASFHASTNQAGWGFVARDQEGRFLEGGAGSISRAANALHAETLGILRSLERVADLGMTRIIIETDVTTVGKAITSTELDRSIYGCLFRQIRELMMSHFVQCRVAVCPRACNSVADSLASYGCTLNQGSCIFMRHAPDFILPLVSGDQPETRD